MEIDWSNKEEIDKIYIHDSIFEGFHYNYEKRQIQLDCENDWLEKVFHFTFQNVIFCNVQSCNFWGPGPHIMCVYLEDEDTPSMRELLKVKTENPDNYKGSRLDRGINYIQIGMELNSGDVLLIGCESVEYTEEGLDLPEKVCLNWSGGMDSALTLYYVRESGMYDVMSLITIMEKDETKFYAYEIGRDLYVQQLFSIGLPLAELEYDLSVSEEENKSLMEKWVKHLTYNHISTVLFGDLYLEEVRAQREEKCNLLGMKATFPLWGRDSKELLNEFIRLGFKGIVTYVDGSVLDESFLGRVIDEEFVWNLPPDVDACGEKGEYHVFVFDGPIFDKPVEFKIAGKYYIDYPNDNDSKQNRYWYLRLEFVEGEC